MVVSLRPGNTVLRRPPLNSSRLALRTGRAYPQPGLELLPLTLRVLKDPKGAIFAIDIVDRNFAEFDPRHDLDEGVLVSKDYYFEVLGIVEQSI